MTQAETKKSYNRLDPKNLNGWRTFMYRISATGCWWWFKIFHALKIIGRENNHTSNFDPFIVGGALWCGRKPVSFMAKQELFAPGFMGWYFDAVGCFAVNRQKLEISTVKSALAVLKHSNWALGIFPEGTRQKDNTGTANISDAKRGVAFFAKAGNAPILPVAIARVGPLNQFVRVRIGELIPPPAGDDLDETTKTVEKALTELLLEARGDYEKTL